MVTMDALEAANHRLLEKKRLFQENTESQILSLRCEGDIKAARKLAFRLMLSPYRRQMIDLFKQDIPEQKKCSGCGARVEYTYSENLLRFTNRECEQCIKKEMMSREEHDKKKLSEFLERKDDEILKIIKISGTPEIFAKAKAKDFKTRFEKDNYFITGPVGTGKTHLSVAMLREYIEELPVRNIGGKYQIDVKDASPVFINVPELLLEIRSSFQEDSTKDERELINRYSSAPFLILDDLGAEKTSEWALQTLYIIINRRCTDTATRTIITSNLTLESVSKKLEERIASRIRGMCKVIKLQGKDWRVQGGKNE